MPSYNNYFPMGYQPMTQYQIPQQQQVQSSNGIVWVQGEAGAKAYPVAPNTSVLLMDSESSSFYIKTTDASGMPSPLRIFDYQERNMQQAEKPQAIQENVEYITRTEFEERLESLKEKPKKKKVIEVEEDE